MNYTAFLSLVVAVADYSYVYTIDVDNDDIFLWYSQANNSLQLTDIYWRRKDMLGSFPNPFNIYTMLFYLSGGLTLECMDRQSGDNILSTQVFIQGLLYIPGQSMVSLYFGPICLNLTHKCILFTRVDYMLTLMTQLTYCICDPAHPLTH